MKVIAENIHVTSKPVKEAIINRDTFFLTKLIRKIYRCGANYIDLNIGPAKGGLEGSMEYLSELCQKESNLPLSFDTTNKEEMLKGLLCAKDPKSCIINSASADPERLEVMSRLAKDFKSFLICLCVAKGGIPKYADQRLELASIILEKTNEVGIGEEKILLDPLVLPVSIDQDQVKESLDALRMFKESFGDSIETVVGLSNISNGSPLSVRPWLNRVYGVLAMGCGLDNAIVDGTDVELIRIMNVIETNATEKKVDWLYLKLYKMMKDFGTLEDIVYDSLDEEEITIYKTAGILLGRQIYSHSYLENY